ncbi:MAG TPA: acyltransferase [Candidatus Omnitrophota bacterium]|nr:acyltransferase [Candidatus Omnitrophota bacterium]HPS36223.1 acyltransferase [Candidatus Omnitrophota bacterium]
MSNDEKALREFRQFDFIDALRGWAFLLVLLVHTDQRIPFANAVSEWTQAVRFGVQLFFVVSAFTLFYSFHVRKEKGDGHVRAFFIRRFFRIAPMFWAAAFFYIAITGFKQLYAPPYEITFWRVLSTCLFVNGWNPDTINNVVPGGWSIAVEMNFYLLLPFFFKYVSSLKKSMLLLALLMVFRLGANFLGEQWISPSKDPLIAGQFLYFWLPNQLPVFGFGFILFHLLRDRFEGAAPATEGSRQKDLVSAGVLLVLCAYCLLMESFFKLKWDVIPPHIIHGAGFLFLAWALALRPFSFFVNRFTRFVGKVSFSAYLCHFFVLDRFTRFWFGFAKKFNPSFHPNLYFFMIFLVGLVGTLAISALTYRWIEQPFQRLGKKIIHRMS